MRVYYEHDTAADKQTEGAGVVLQTYWIAQHSLCAREDSGIILLAKVEYYHLFP